MADDGARAGEVYVCTNCGKGFRSSSGLCDHERTHTGKAPYKCCGHLYFSRANLDRHRCAKHGQKRPYSCVKCGKTFALRTDVRSHIKTHDEGEFRCEVCGLQMKKRSQFQDHMSMHKGEKRHVCQCGKAYLHSSSLSRHRRSCQKKTDTPST